MDYEKKYNEALEDMRVIYPNLKGDAKLAVEHAFPELRESEDEMIRKAIRCYVEDMPDSYGFAHGIGKADMLAWLEKQKDRCLFCDQHLKGYLAGRKVTEEEKQKETKGLDVTDFCQPIHPDIAKVLPDVIDELTWGDEKQKDKCKDCPSRGNTHSYLKGYEDGQKEQKPAEWSEEDERMMKCCLIAINHYEKTCNIGDHLPTKFNIEGYLTSVDKVKSWLKSLRPQKKEDLPRWKKWYNGACGNCNNIPIALVKVGCSYALTDCLGITGQEYIMLSDLEKLPKEDGK